MSILEYFILKKEFLIEVNYEESLKKLKTKASGFTVNEMHYGNCKITSDFSIGTAIINKYKSIPISTDLSLLSMNNNSVKVSLKTEPRIEIFIIIKFRNNTLVGYDYFISYNSHILSSGLSRPREISTPKN